MAGRITHQGKDVQFGGEKETRLTSMSPGDKLKHTQAANWEPGLLGHITPDMLEDGAKAKAAGQVQWADLNDKGKAQYSLAYQKAHGKFPKITVKPNPDYSEIAWEKNGWIEIVSKPFNPEGIAKFLREYGWGHVHTSFMRGAKPAEQKQMLSWVAMANLWCFMGSLEGGRGSFANGEDDWRFRIKGLSIPTEEHMERYGQIFGGKNRAATAFAKHVIVNVRGNGKQYGDPNRIGTETRGGTSEQKQHILDSLLNGLHNGHWGSQPFAWGDGGFRLVRIGNDLRRDKDGDELQPNAIPSDAATLLAEAIQRHPVKGVKEADAARLFQMMAGSSYSDAPALARLARFDQRAAVPLLNWEALPFLNKAEKERVGEAQRDFIAALDALSKKNLSSRAVSHEIGEAIVAFAQAAKLSEPLGRWLDGPKGRQNLIPF